MKCMNCGAVLTDSAYCPECGCDVSVQKQAIILSGLYYNQGLEKAQVRDLSGAIDQLRRSLKFNKTNIAARNLLGLVYFEVGEVVAALSEWVISKNMAPENNIASLYIEDLQKDSSRLDMINATIKKYNLALDNARSGNEDVAVIQLKKILSQNPKLIKGYHLLSLLYIQRGEYARARQLLKRAIKIDRTNTTSLRFLQEVDERTGQVTSYEPRTSIWTERENRANTRVVAPPAAQENELLTNARERSMRTALINIAIGGIIGAAAIWFLIMPARTSAIREEANRKVAEYSSVVASESAQIAALSEQIEQSEETVATANEQIAAANTKAVSYENLFKALNAYNNNSIDTATNALAAVDTEILSMEAKAVYDNTYAAQKTALLSTYKNNGIGAFNQQEYETAIRFLEQAKAIDDSDYDILNYLAHAYRLQGQAENADANFNRIIELFPDTQRAANAAQYLSTNIVAETAPAEGQQ